MGRAFCFIREQPSYRREAFASGLSAAGLTVSCQDYHAPSIPWGSIGRDDVLVIWNRYSTVEQLANRFESQGGRVIVAENGYLGADESGIQYYALALKGHNGSGQWPIGGPERWERLGIELKPWRESGDHVLVCPNRSFGPKGFAMPQGWGEATAQRLRQITKREVRLRPHPGNWQQKTEEVRASLADDLKGAWAVVIWASSAGLHALISGIPVFREAPHWVGGDASQRDVMRIDAPAYPDRLPALQRMAWAQFTIAEISGGEPFRRLLAL